MPDFMEVHKKQTKRRSSPVLEIRSRRKAIIVFCILFFTASILLRLLSYDLYSRRKVCKSSLPVYFQVRSRISTNLSQIETGFIKRTPGYQYFDNGLISPQNNIYLQKHKLHYCKIDKNMGSTMQAILCFIDDQRRHGRLFFKQPWGPGLPQSSCSRSTADGDLRSRFIEVAANWNFFDDNSEIYHFAIVRDPISRFLSAFIDICVNTIRQGKVSETLSDQNLCFQCHDDLDCFLPLLHDYLHKMAEHMPVQRWARDWHFYPQAWYCDFDRKIEKYHLFRYERGESFWTELVGVLRARNVSQDLIANIQEKLATKTAAHSTFAVSDKYAKKLLNNATLLDYIRKIYYLDFLWFDYRQ